MIKIRIFTSLLLCLIVFSPLKAQKPVKPLNVAEIQFALQKSQVLGSVLYVAAHPDDENTRLIAYLSGEKKYRTAYLSLTRGDGGQNLIGDEKGPLLGILRTQELLAARRIDGGEQMFSRALDFGYSKGPEETLDLWEREEVLADVVWAIRKYQPDVIITRFPGPARGGGGHGHHTASAMLAKEAFSKAADDKYFREQLSEVEPWQAKRILWNTWQPGRDPDWDYSETITIDVGGYNALLGKSYGEIAAESRSMHKCQAFGTAKRRGKQNEYLEHTAGSRAEKSLFEGIDASWSRIEGGEFVGELLQKAYVDFRPTQPQDIIPTLVQAYKVLDKLDPSVWKMQKLQEIRDLIVACSGLWFEATTKTEGVAIGESVEISFSALSRSNFPLKLLGGEIVEGNADMQFDINEELSGQASLWTKNINYEVNGQIPTQPYWLERPFSKGMYDVNQQSLIGLPETPSALKAVFKFRIGGENPLDLSIPVPVQYKYVDRAVGEIYQPFNLLPPVSISTTEAIYLFANNKDLPVNLTIRSHSANAKGKVSLNVPKGWKVSPQTIDVNLDQVGKEMRVSLILSPPEKQSTGELTASFSNGNQSFSYGLRAIAYDHIPTQTYFPSASAKLVKVNVKIAGDKIGYVMGSGDEIPTCLRQLGYKVDLLEDEEITVDNLSKYDAIVAGIRAYNRRERMPYHHDEILKYVDMGGTYIVQYNTTYSLLSQQPGPYPIKLSRDRVTVEEAPVKILDSDHPLLNTPNKITENDFDNWIQERGLYFPNEWDDRYTALTALNDPGESEKKGALLTATYGKGTFIYTGYSMFRELPAGVPGAYRLFANLLAGGKAVNQ